MKDQSSWGRNRLEKPPIGLFEPIKKKNPTRTTRVSLSSVNQQMDVNFTQCRVEIAHVPSSAGFSPCWRKTLSCLSTSSLSGRRGSLASPSPLWLCLENDDRKKKREPPESKHAVPSWSLRSRDYKWLVRVLFGELKLEWTARRSRGARGCWRSSRSARTDSEGCTRAIRCDRISLEADNE